MTFKEKLSNRKLFFQFLYFVAYLCLASLFVPIYADPLPSWNKRPAKVAILQFIKEVTQEGNQGFIPVEERIVTFDEDGTLWVEQPIYTEIFFAIDFIKSRAPSHPEWQNKEPFK